ncbi:uncharacterized protein [Phyllobates terribilis]|uniref:uncharacterized protein n=1 Tax=Phyllobates terribilis TaxID=111132 RepID=UPI003CCAA098
MEFVRNMERRRLIKPQDILATLQSIPEDELESELQEHVFDSDSDEDFIPQNISSESEDSEGTNPEDIPSTSTGDRAHAVMLPRDHPPGRGQKKSAKRPRNERTTDNDGGEGNATTNTREGESEGILVSADGIQWKPVEIGEHLPGRRDSQNILREAPGPTGYARRNIIIDSPLSINNNVLIVKCPLDISLLSKPSIKRRSVVNNRRLMKTQKLAMKLQLVSLYLTLHFTADSKMTLGSNT